VSINGVAIRDIAVAVPTTRRDQSHWGAAAAKLTASTGIRERRVVEELSFADLAENAAREVWGAAPQAIVCVTQTPDCRIPPMANVLHGRLGLGTACAAFDVNQGCSGYPYGLMVAGSLVQAGVPRVLLIAGDCLSTVVSKYDRATEPLFGDAVSATILEADEDSPPMHIGFGSDGAGVKHLRLEHGDAACLRMNGAEVFQFASETVPKMVFSMLELPGWGIGDIEAVVPHQPNALMLDHLREKCRVPVEKWLVGVVGNFGNVSSASIPLALVLSGRRGKMLMAGFGGGWSYCGACVDLSTTRIHDLVEVPEP
jgi:3-oxoacyl-[acyl-carrier-protein] synthase-3